MVTGCARCVEKDSQVRLTHPLTDCSCVGVCVLRSLRASSTTGESTLTQRPSGECYVHGDGQENIHFRHNIRTTRLASTHR